MHVIARTDIEQEESLLHAGDRFFPSMCASKKS